MKEDKLDLKTKTQITIPELQRLLVELKEHQRETCFRFRILGELWNPSFLRIISVNHDHAILLNESKNRLVSVNLSLIMQFEIDIGYQEYQPNHHYEVKHHK